MADQLGCAVDLLKRMPPKDISANLEATLELAPDIIEDLLASVDQPLKEMLDTSCNRPFLICDYNRDGDSYRSPWTSQYFPPMEDGIQPPEELRQLEVIANEAFDSFRELYYEGGTSSCWFWVTPDNDWACCVAIKKDSDKLDCPGTWNSVHVVDISMGTDAKGKSNATYKLTTTVLLEIAAANPAIGSSNLSGALTRREEKTLPCENNLSHVQNIGSMLEAMEKRMLLQMEEVYFGKTNEIMSKVRVKARPTGVANQSNMFAEMMKKRSASTSS
jgi:capping protein (actin filament) muscle Z-line, beta